MSGLLLSAVLAFSWANRAGICFLAGHTPHTVQKPLPAGAAAPAPASPELRVLFFADFGDDTCQQADVAKAMTRAQARAPFDLVLSPGDNVYECGPDVSLAGAADCEFAEDANTVRPGYRPPDDRRFRKNFENALGGLSRDGAPVPLFLALGNHDVHAGKGCLEGGLSAERIGRVRACLEVAHRGPHWSMPARHYTLDRGPARFIVVDSNVIGGDYGGFTLEQEAAFVAEASAGCATRPCFLVGHHPPASAGEHAGALLPGNPWRARMDRLLGAAREPVAAWFGGHDHDLQHLRTGPLDVFVSGNGSRWRDEKFAVPGPPDAQQFFGSTAWGFATLEVWGGGWSVRFEDVEGKALHCCRATFPGRCEPVACGPAPAGPTAARPGAR